MVKQELTDKYYKQNLCDSSCCCKLYNPLLTQGECHYYNEWCELKDKISDLEAKLAESETKIVELELKLLKRDVTKYKKADTYIIEENIDLKDSVRKLKQQLAKSEQEANDWKQRFESSEERFKTFNSNGVTALNLKNDKIEELKQQLAESQKKKEDFKTMYFNKCLDYEHLHEKFDDKCAEFELKEYDYKQTIFEKNQDKISFAVERLRKAKFDALMLGGLVQGETFFINSEHYRNYIDNQIASLKKEMK